MALFWASFSCFLLFLDYVISCPTPSLIVSCILRKISSEFFYDQELSGHFRLGNCSSVFTLSFLLFFFIDIQNIDQELQKVNQTGDRLQEMQKELNKNLTDRKTEINDTLKKCGSPCGKVSVENLTPQANFDTVEWGLEEREISGWAKWIIWLHRKRPDWVMGMVNCSVCLGGHRNAIHDTS